MEREFDAYKLSCCMCPSNYNRFWDRARYLWKKSSFYHTLLHSTPPLGGFPSEDGHPLWYGKTRMVSLPEGEKISKICLFILTWFTNVTDGRTDRRTDRRTLHDSIDRACIASRGKNRRCHFAFVCSSAGCGTRIWYGWTRNMQKTATPVNAHI